jgi:hypothetical protein
VTTSATSRFRQRGCATFAMKKVIGKPMSTHATVTAAAMPTVRTVACRQAGSDSTSLTLCSVKVRTTAFVNSSTEKNAVASTAPSAAR